MSQTKLEIFKIPFSNNLDFDKKTQDKINEFLNDENNIYISHSTSISTESITEYGSPKTVSRHLVISLVYKDLKASSYDLKQSSSKIKSVVRKEIIDGKNIKKPQIETELEKEICSLTSSLREKEA